MDPYFAVIMAGGGGTRLWPLSRQKRPKQALQLLGDGSMFQLSVRRLAPVFAPERILVVTSAAYAVDLRDQCPELPAENFILEPEPRGTAAAIGLAAWHIQRRDPAALMACLTADHFIANEAHFCDALTIAAHVAQEEYLVTLGITPDYPATGFGYIQRGQRLGILGGFEVFHSSGFKEKPDRSQAECMVDSGEYYWNSGMFIWRAGRILQEFARHMPGFYEPLSRLDDSPERLAEAWSKAPITTIDYGIMERTPAKDVALIPVKDLGWNDVGSWDSLLDILQPDQDGNVVVGEHVGLSTTGSLIHATRRHGQHALVATIGV
jgi:mannose-1-phosphate guanylyltransferase